MRDFFKGWLRKVGCVALVMACLFLSGWVRNHFYADHMQITITDGSSVSTLSMYDSIQIVYRSHRSFGDQSPIRPAWFLFGNSPVTRHDRGVWDPWKSETTPGNDVHVDLMTPAFRFFKMTYGSRKPSRVHVTSVVLSDLPAAFFLTLLSAWLLLSRSQSLAPRTIEEAQAAGD